MIESETPQIEEESKPGLRHWLFQSIPPLVLLVPLFSTSNGTSFVFLLGFFLIPVFISLISILVKLVRFRKRKYYLLRPGMTLGLFLLLMNVAHLTYEIALDEAIDAANVIHEQCNVNSVCPGKPEGWVREGMRLRRSDLGTWFKYSASYVYEAYAFRMRVYQGPDLGHYITGGVAGPLKVEVYVEPGYAR